MQNLLLDFRRAEDLNPAHLPALRGGLLALLAAILFGVSTPLLQRAGTGLGPFTTAALLYCGAAIMGALLRQPVEREAALRRTDLTRLAWMALFGAAIGPVALAWGLQHTSGTSASLMLALEALFTAVLARALYREVMDRRVWSAMLLLLAGRHRTCTRPWPKRRCATPGIARRVGSHRRLGHRQHVVSFAGRARSRAGGARQVIARRRRDCPARGRGK